MPSALPTGLISGLAATVPMTAVMELLHRQLPRRDQYPLPPREITQKLTRDAGVERELDEGQHRALALASHFAYGASCGTAYALLDEQLRPRLRRALPAVPPAALDAAHGTAFGLLVWTASYLGWLPAAGILKPATRHPAPRNALMIAAHVVFGASLGLMVGAIRRARR